MIATLALVLALSRPPQTAGNLGYYMQPSIRGDQVVFVSQGDLWAVNRNGGVARALTSHVAPASFPAVSPDGRWVAFSGTYEGPTDAYLIPIEGGIPKRLTTGENVQVRGWTPDGRILVASYRYSSLPDVRLANIDPATLREQRIPLSQASEGAFDGADLFFTRQEFQGSHTRRYKGGTAQNLWRFRATDAEAKPLTPNYPGTSKNPMVWQGRVYFLSDRDGTMNLWSMNEDGGTLKQLTRYADWEIRSASLDQGRIAYQLGADLYVYDIAKQTDQKLHITLQSDFDASRPHWIKKPMPYLSNLALSADGSKVALTARGQVFVAPAEPGRLVEATRKSGVRYRNALFAPEGKSLLVLSDESGETEWWRFPANGVGNGAQVTMGADSLVMNGAVSPDGNQIAYADKNWSLWIYDIAKKTRKKVITLMNGQPDQLAWSPDSRWLAFVDPTFTFSRILIYSVATGKSVAVTSDRFDSTSPAWSPDGKWLYFLSDRNLASLVDSPWGPRQPEPFFDSVTKIYQLGLQKGLRSPFQPTDELTPTPKEEKPDGKPVKVEIDFGGIEARQWVVPIEPGNYRSLSVNGGRLFFLASPLQDKPELDAVDIANHDVEKKTLAGGVAQYVLSGDGNKLLVQIGPKLFVSPSQGDKLSLEHPVDLSGWSFEVDPREEWRQMYTEAWRLERDYFYDPNMHSLDWKAVYGKYLPLVDRVRDRSELSDVLGQMISELSALHMFVYGGDERQSNEDVSVGFLGAEFDRAPDGFRVTKIYEGDPDFPDTLAPLARPDVAIEVGDVIKSVNGVDATTAPAMSALLRNQVGKQVLLKVKDHASGKERMAIAIPQSSGDFFDLRYTDWERSRRAQVEKEGAGTMGYVHLRAMGGEDFDTWAREFYPVFDRAGLIIDVRHNQGGSIDSWIIEKLLRKPWFYWQGRVGNPTWNMQWAFRGHVVVLCDEYTMSDGEAFTEGIKRLGLGKVIGTRTWGGEIWLTSSNFLEDGGIATAAEFGVYGPQGRWLIEGHGVDPDIVVDNLPHATYLGKDAQLEAAISYLAKEIKDHPVPVPPHPAYPNKRFPPPGG